MGLGNDTIQQIKNTNDINTLARIEAFVANSDDRDDKKIQVRDMVRAKIASLQGQQQADAAKMELQKQAQQFRENRGAIKEQWVNPFQEQARRDLAKDLSSVDQDANRRGLLYSGIRSGARNELARAYGNAASQVEANINRDLDIEQSNLDKGVIDAAFADQTQKQKQYDLDYQNALKARQARNENISKIAGGVGSAAGSAYGAYKKDSD